MKRTWSHRALDRLGVPRKKDGNRLGLRKRTDMAKKRRLIRSEP
jgi:hypothetical protein